MNDDLILKYSIKDPLELNVSYTSFINEGGLFVPTDENFSLGDKVLIDLQLPGDKETLRIEGTVIWITPRNTSKHVLPGVSVQFTGDQASLIRKKIEKQLSILNEID